MTVGDLRNTAEWSLTFFFSGFTLIRLLPVFKSPEIRLQSGQWVYYLTSDASVMSVLIKTCVVPESKLLKCGAT